MWLGDLTEILGFLSTCLSGYSGGMTPDPDVFGN